MAGVLDFIFGSGALKKAAGSGDNPPASKPQGNQDAGLDMGKLAQDAADRARATTSGKPASPKGLSSTMTPQTPNSGSKGKQ